MLARLLLDQADEHARSGQDIRRFAAINSLQDSVEVFLLAIAEEVNANLEVRSDFVQYLDRIDAKISPSTLPFRAQLIRLNRIRVNSKHALIEPHIDDLDKLTVIAREFFVEVCRTQLSVEFSTIHLIDLIRSDEIRGYLESAAAAHAVGNYAQTLIESRKAFYRIFESNSDVSSYADTNTPTFSIFSLGNEAPAHAKSKAYIDKNVRDPFDFIVLDHNSMNSRIVVDNIDTVVFWNIWRLTPRVFHSDLRGWLVKRELSKFDEENLEHNATYVLENMISIVLKKQDRQSRLRTTSSGSGWIINLKNKEVKLLDSADRNGLYFNIIPPEIRQLRVIGSTPGLKEDDLYWHVSDFDVKMTPIAWGYIHNDDVEF